MKRRYRISIEFDSEFSLFDIQSKMLQQTWNDQAIESPRIIKAEEVLA